MFFFKLAAGRCGRCGWRTAAFTGCWTVWVWFAFAGINTFLSAPLGSSLAKTLCFCGKPVSCCSWRGWLPSPALRGKGMDKPSEQRAFQNQLVVLLDLNVAKLALDVQDIKKAITLLGLPKIPCRMLPSFANVNRAMENTKASLGQRILGNSTMRNEDNKTRQQRCTVNVIRDGNTN